MGMASVGSWVSILGSQLVQLFGKDWVWPRWRRCVSCLSRSASDVSSQLPLQPLPACCHGPCLTVMDSPSELRPHEMFLLQAALVTVLSQRQESD